MPFAPIFRHIQLLRERLESLQDITARTPRRRQRIRRSTRHSRSEGLNQNTDTPIAKLITERKILPALKALEKEGKITKGTVKI